MQGRLEGSEEGGSDGDDEDDDAFARCRTAASLFGAGRTCSATCAGAVLRPRTAGLAAAAVESWLHALASGDRKGREGPLTGPWVGQLGLRKA